jgi:hypothetical protein
LRAAFRGRHRWPSIDRPAYAVTDDQAWPRGENDGEVDEARRQRHVGDASYPEVVGTVRDQILRQVREDRTVVATTRRSGLVIGPLLGSRGVLFALF